MRSRPSPEVRRFEQRTCHARLLQGILWALLPYLSLEVRAPAARANSWWPKHMPNIGNCEVWMSVRRLCTVSKQWVGSPGPLLMKTPSKWCATFSRGKSNGKQVTEQPLSTRERRMFSFTPQSIKATCISPVPELTWNGCLVETLRTRLICSGSTNASSCSSSYSSPIVIFARVLPCSRRYVTIARVSTPVMAGYVSSQDFFLS